MTDLTAAPQKHPFVRRVRQLAADYPEAVAIALYALVAAGAAFAAYFSVFTTIQPYDDEGTILVGLNAFAQGDTLYHDIWSVYGPFYYEIFGGPMAFLGAELTTDSARSIVIVVWVVASLCFGLAAHRLTGRLAFGLTGMMAAFAALGILANEPMHPQGLSVLLLGAFVLVAAAGLDDRAAAWSGAACGALLAALALTKLNLGAYALAAVALAAVLTFDPLRRRALLRWAVVIAAVLVPVVVMARDFEESWARELMLIEMLAMAAIVIAAWPSQPRRGENDEGLARWLLAGAVAFVAFSAVVLGAILLTGPSPADVYDGIVVRAFGIRDLLTIELNFPSGSSVDWAVVALAAAALVARQRRAGPAAPLIWPGALRVAVGVIVWLGVAGIVPISFAPSSADPVLVPMLLAWIAAVPPRGAVETPPRRFLRVLVPALAVAESLQVYPVAGSQTGIAAAAFVPVGALCLADGLGELRAWSAARGDRPATELRGFETVATLALAAVVALNTIVLTGSEKFYLYREQPALALPGADIFHPPAPAASTYVSLVDLLHRYRCTALISYPSIDSLYLWSGLPVPTTKVPNAWMEGLDSSEQQRVVDELRASPRPCAIRNDGLTEMYFDEEPPPNRPLVNYVLNDFTPATAVGDFEFLLPKQ